MASKETSVSNEKFVAYVERYNDVALITVHPRPADDRYGVDFSKTVSCYETLSDGACDSARREITKLSQEAA